VRILLLDAGVVAGTGHNQAILEELDAQTRGRAGVELVCAVAHGIDAGAFGHLACRLLPAFQLHGYARLVCGDQPRAAVAKLLDAACASDLAALQPERFDLVLMPTAHPMHLLALARLAGRLPATTRIACGLLMPPAFWALDDEAAAMLEAAMHEAASTLACRANTFIYSETGRYRIGAATVASAILLPPVATSTLQRMALLAVQPRTGSAAARFGFFGAPEPRKGFDLLAALMQAGLPDGVSLSLRLPASAQAFVAEWSKPALRVDGVAAATDNARFFDDMASVDVVLAFYAPQMHRTQMSGMVAEAICLGKPLLLAEGCDALIDFLARHAPGSYLCRPWTVEGLRSGLAAPASEWRAAARAAMASAPAMRELKSAERYLAITSGGAW